MNEVTRENPDVWLGLRRCGCPVAIVVDSCPPRCDQKVHRRAVEKSKREFLRDGLSVIHATWEEWETKYRPNFLRECEHTRAEKAAS
jgi:hypothetical protein